MLIERLNIDNKPLTNMTAIVTGGAGGIGLETAKALCCLGARVSILDIDESKCLSAYAELSDLFKADAFEIDCIDITDELKLIEFVHHYIERFYCPDIIINNAATVIVGASESITSEAWDIGYRVNLKAPILITGHFLPGMRKRNSGVICFVPSSGAAPFLGAYEVFKTAQAEFCSTLCAELENTSVFAYAIAPGLVKTDSADKAIEKVAQLMMIPVSSIYTSNEKNMLTVEEAGTAFALSVLSAEKYNGSEIGAVQVLNDYKDIYPFEQNEKKKKVSEEEINRINEIVEVFMRQSKGWMERNIFERQWLIRDFKKKTGCTPDQMKKELEKLRSMALLGTVNDIEKTASNLEVLKSYYVNQYKLLQGWEKNKDKLKENSMIIMGWIKDIENILKIVLS